MSVKPCRMCKEDKDPSDFFVDRSQKDALSTSCKVCLNKKNRVYYHNNKHIARNWNFKKKFGISLEEYDALNEKQKGLCSICHKLCSSGNRLAVDHDHKTAKIRGLLCQSCNVGLGYFKDNPELLVSAAAYLKEHNVSKAV